MYSGVCANNQEVLLKLIDDFEQINFTTIGTFFTTDQDEKIIITHDDNIEKLIDKTNLPAKFFQRNNEYHIITVIST